MAFIRTKKVKKWEYAYIVENVYRKRGNPVKQKTKKYLGKVLRFDKVNSKDFLEQLEIKDMDSYIKSKEIPEIISDLVEVELANHGFVKEKNKWVKGDCAVDVKKRKFLNSKGNNVALAFNEGLLTSYTVRKIINFNAYDPEDGYDFAKMFVEAGLDVPKDVFVGIFSKIYK